MLSEFYWHEPRRHEKRLVHANTVLRDALEFLIFYFTNQILEKCQQILFILLSGLEPHNLFKKRKILSIISISIITCINIVILFEANYVKFTVNYSMIWWPISEICCHTRNNYAALYGRDNLYEAQIFFQIGIVLSMLQTGNVHKNYFCMSKMLILAIFSQYSCCKINRSFKYWPIRDKHRKRKEKHFEGTDKA